ncbi:alpha-L-fucosidase [Mariniphaga anaerophila]|uniref:alpha-L-fucosidase n=1 Tax=Mariniphaga anaerophila TaxID=1484053 RepID=A0A1M5E6T5_9BACT|nr:alpha-L-fucosidase [Mariniphaga anaerophila]SHF74782.1 alpha-L-fucosidase [Mariniphaga anaerophila]
MKKLFFAISLLFIFFSAGAQETNSENFLNLNKPERLEWFRTLGFGMFIHFSFDSQLGVVISHSMAGASDDYLNRFVNELPKTFNPKDYSAKEIAALAKLSGMKYIVFTTKHHSGFCMWDTQTTSLNIMNTPYGKDMLAEYVDATREAGLAVGFYYSPEDFNFLYENGLQVRRRFPNPLPDSTMLKYLELLELQCMELMAQYGDIDIIFFDGGEGPLQEKCKKVVWELQPDIVVTRGAIKTPEQTVLGISSDEPWESCITMGTQWAYKPTNEAYKTGNRLIEILIETRAKGGNLLLNVGPKPNGELPEQQEANLREIAAWNFINHEAVENVAPWILPNEENIWFTWNPREKTVYAFLTKIPDWARGERKNFLIKSVKTTEKSEVSVLGQSGELVEYQPKTDAKTYFEQKKDGLHISCVRAQRIYNNHKWPNPIVLKITHVEPALEPPAIITLPASFSEGNSKLTFHGQIAKTGDSNLLKAGFQYREYAGFVEELYSDEWKETGTISVSETMEFSVNPKIQKKGKEYQVRAFADHPKLRVYGDITRVRF